MDSQLSRYHTAIGDNYKAFSDLETLLFRIQNVNFFTHQIPIIMDLLKARQTFDLPTVNREALEAGEYGLDTIQMVVMDILRIVTILVALFKKPSTALFFDLALIVAKYDEPKAVFILAWNEFKDLDKAEQKAVMDTIRDNFDLDDDDLETKVENLIGVILKAPNQSLESIDVVLGLVSTIKGFKDDPIETIKKVSHDHIPKIIDEGFETWEWIESFYIAITVFFKKDHPPA